MSRILELIERLGARVIDNVTALGNFVLFLGDGALVRGEPALQARLTIRQMRTNRGC